MAPRSRSLILTERFARADTEAARAVFDERFADPRRARGDRFVWDWWHVPGQYTALRTPAWDYFPAPLYRRLHAQLVQYGRDVLGCHDISPPWLSCYVDGCSQQLHGDLPHGPWAFVLSLTRWRARGNAFTGGETLMLRDEVLDMWDDFRSVRGVEEPDLVRAIAPRFGRLVVFDPRIPHGVREVTGTRDPRAGRLVVHGWFVQPRPFVRGPLAMRAVSARIAELTDWLGGALGGLPVAGMMSLAIDVAPGGRVRAVTLLSDTTRVARAHEPDRRRFVRAVRAELARWQFPRAAAASRITLPLVFER